jgi:trimeric autotransporter adhesin
MKLTFTCCLMLIASACLAQNIGIGTTSPNSSAQLDISSGSRGILIPRMTTVAVSGIVNPAKGLMVFDSTRNQLLVNMGSPAVPDWENIIANSGWGLSGNPVTFDGSVIGTTTPFKVQFVVNNVPSGEIDSGGENTSLGYGILTASANSAENTAMGWKAGSTADGAQNTAMGSQALMNNTVAYNTALGAHALIYNTVGLENTAVGTDALFENLTGGYNSALGCNALFYNLSDYNTGIGEAALYSNSSGTANTALGSEALSETINSSYNTAVGYFAGHFFDNGYNNVFVGANTGVNADGYYNVIAVGQGTICTASSQARFGNTATNSIGGYANWTNFSDGRYKKNMKENVIGLDFIMRLRPVTYNLDVSSIQAHLSTGNTQRATSSASRQTHGESRPAGSAHSRPAALFPDATMPQTVSGNPSMQQAIAQRETDILSGFSAQEVEKAAKDAGYEFSGVDKPKNASDFYGLRYADFVVPLVKAVQEQQQMIKDLQKEIEALKKQH